MIVSRTNYPWDTRYFYYFETHKEYEIKSEKDYVQELSARSAPNAPTVLKAERSGKKTFIIDYRAISKDLGYVSLGEIGEGYFQKESSGFTQITVKSLKIVTHGNPQLFQHATLNIKGAGEPRGVTWQSQKLVLPEHIVARTNTGYAYYDLSLRGQTAEFNSLLLAKTGSN